MRWTPRPACSAPTLRCAAPRRTLLTSAPRCAAYLDPLPPGQNLKHAAVAIANPVEGDRVRMTHYHRKFSIEATRQQLQLDTLVVVNEDRKSVV